eukprot:1180508-Prorocentrum_minimum.AAC.2
MSTLRLLVETGQLGYWPISLSELSKQCYDDWPRRASGGGQTGRGAAGGGLEAPATAGCGTGVPDGPSHNPSPNK